MIWATQVLKPPPSKLYKIPFTKISLFRPVPMVAAGAFGVGAIIPGLLPFGVVSTKFFGITGLLGGMLAGGMLLGVAVMWSPTGRGTLLTWARAWINWRSKVVTVGGRDVQLYVGTHRITRVEEGEYDIESASIEVAPGQVDATGRPLRHLGPDAKPRRR